MRALLTSKAARRTLRPILELIDQRIERQVRRAVADRPTVALKSENGALQRELQTLRNRQRPLELFFDGTGRGASRLPSAPHLNRTIKELAEVAAWGQGRRGAQCRAGVPAADSPGGARGRQDHAAAP